MYPKIVWTPTLLILSIVLTLLAACSSEQSAPPAQPAKVETTEAAAGEPAEAAGDEAPPAEEITLTVYMMLDAGIVAVLEPFFDQFEAETGVRLELIDTFGNSGSENLAEFQQILNARSSQGDVFMIDVIWPGILAEHALDLSAYVPATELEAHIPAILEDYRVDDKLVALPVFGHAGLLFYRADLLNKYGFDAPPVTWDDLEEMAAVIQSGERAEGNDEFWGFVWQGANYEGLTCAALEWQVSHDGGRIIEPDGTITVNNPGAVAALERAAGWVDTISPAKVIDYDESNTSAMWENGNVAFMRHWPYFWHPDIHNTLIEGRDGVTILPTATSDHAATLGGWALMVSKYSQHPDLAVKFVQLMTGPEVQKQRALDGDPPTIEALYHDPELLAARPYMADMLPVVQSAVARPSTVTGLQYAEVSAAYYNHVHSILTGQVTAAEGVANLEAELIDITGFEAKMP